MATPVTHGNQRAPRKRSMKNVRQAWITAVINVAADAYRWTARTMRLRGLASIPDTAS